MNISDIVHERLKGLCIEVHWIGRKKIGPIESAVLLLDDDDNAYAVECQTTFGAVPFDIGSEFEVMTEREAAAHIAAEEEKRTTFEREQEEARQRMAQGEEARERKELARLMVKYGSPTHQKA
jgi:hypothetical protein